MSTSVVVQGGSQDIAAIISDLYSPTFKTQFKNWLKSIPSYPKAFKFLMAPITDLVDFRANDLFPKEKIKWGCEFNKDKLEFDKKTKKYFYTENKKKVVCKFASRDDMLDKIKRKRVSLKRAIEFYMEQGPISISDVSIPAGEPGCDTYDVPSCEKINKDGAHFEVLFDMMDGLQSEGDSNENIPMQMLRSVRHRNNEWYTADKDGRFHFFNGYSTKSNDAQTNKRNEEHSNQPVKVSIFGLQLTCDDSVLVLKKEDYDASKDLFTNLEDVSIGRQLAKLKWPSASRATALHMPCNVKWSNAMRFDPSDNEGKCVHFSATSKGALYVILAAIPNNKDTWYYVEISQNRIGIYKGQNLIKDIKDNSALPLGDDSLYQQYFVCVMDTEDVTIVEYGKDTGDKAVYLTMFDRNNPIHPHFYSFANGEYQVEVMDIHIVERNKLQAKCKGKSQEDSVLPQCVEKCHKACDPLAGCKSEKEEDCNACRYASEKNKCVLHCQNGEKPDDNKQCRASIDVKMNQDADVKAYKVGHLSSNLDDFTACFWHTLTDIKDKNYKKLSILQYRYKDATKWRNIMDIGIQELNGYNGARLCFESQFAKNLKKPEVLSGFIKRNSEYKWYMYCVTRVGSTGLITAKFDGRENGIQTTQAPGAQVPKNGNLFIGGNKKQNRFTGWVTGINIWNRVLKQEEISEMAMYCGGLSGNLLSWSQITKKLEKNLDDESKASPSTCKAPKMALV